MDFSSILSYLQNLLSNKQSMQGSQFGQNLGLQQQALGQQANEFSQNLGQQGNEFTQNLALEKQKQDEANALAQQQFGLQQQGQNFNQNLTSQDNVVPGSAQWASMAAFLNGLQNQPKTSPVVQGAKVTFPGGNNIPGFFY
jgi:hypothetical protein